MARTSLKPQRKEVAPEVIEAKRKARGNLETQAGFISQLCFLYLNPIMRLAGKGDLDAGDLYVPSDL